MTTILADVSVGSGAGHLLSPWQVTTTEITEEPIDASTTKITAKIIVEQPHTFGPGDTLTFGINGDVTTNSDTYVQSFEFFADGLPSGDVQVTADAAPDAALASSQQVVLLQIGGKATRLDVTPGQTTVFNVPAGSYTVTAAELVNANETVVANARASPGQLTVVTGQSAAIAVSYTAVNKHSALNVTLQQLSSPIDNERLSVSVIDGSSGQPLSNSFLSDNNQTTALRRLPASGSAVVSTEILLNNVKYSASKTVTLSNSLIEVAITSSDVKTQDIDTTGFVELPIQVTSETTTRAGKVIPIRLQSTKSALVYSENVDISSSGSSKFSVPVAPGEYLVQVSGFLQGSVVYAVEAPTKINVSSDGSTKLSLTGRRGADLDVRGFPNFLSFGALTDLFDMEGKDLTNAKVSAIFKYAGNDGAGDPGTYLTDDPATTRTVELAAKIESKLGSGHTVLPIMISYTCNLSLGAVPDQLGSGSQHAHSFANLILSLNLAKKTGKPEVPAGYIVNADFLGETQKHGFGPDYSMPVRAPLEDALAHHSISTSVPSSITDTLKGYVTAVNWLFRTVAPEVTFAWQVNLWGGGSSTWIYSHDGSDATSPKTLAKGTADYLKRLQVYGGEWSPDFLAVDRYEADDFTQRGYVNSYCYGSFEWARFYDFCATLSLELQTPVAPWQIPASRIPSAKETVANLELEHWGSGGTYLFGDPAIGSSVDNINPTILDIKPSSLVPHKDVRGLFTAALPYDLSYPKYFDFPVRGIFSVLLGGGATTGVVTTIGKTGLWTQEKVSAYMTAPVGF
ncbi:putative carbohydrate binding domain protein [Cercophora samala]|uniref:Carbohydrate binding domain protein n=1 Tax=Cercophora samala TaxID=330535 RepID=A0AA39ZFY0_9PEZI|nr:putative carbohydrate binding domain protein [Cercophora samala]